MDIGFVARLHRTEDDIMVVNRSVQPSEPIDRCHFVIVDERNERRSGVIEAGIAGNRDSATLEELRVLPALLCGVIVISEAMSLRDEIPYAQFVIWARRDERVATAAKVHADYAANHARIFGDPLLTVTLAALRSANLAAVQHAIGRNQSRGRTVTRVPWSQRGNSP